VIGFANFEGKRILCEFTDRVSCETYSNARNSFGHGLTPNARLTIVTLAELNLPVYQARLGILRRVHTGRGGDPRSCLKILDQLHLNRSSVQLSQHTPPAIVSREHRATLASPSSHPLFWAKPLSRKSLRPWISISEPPCPKRAKSLPDTLLQTLRCS
jgi:hypothetical protein